MKEKHKVRLSARVPAEKRASAPVGDRKEAACHINYGHSTLRVLLDKVTLRERVQEYGKPNAPTQKKKIAAMLHVAVAVVIVLIDVLHCNVDRGLMQLN